MLISINSINKNNVGTKLITDFFVVLFVPLILIMVYRRRLKEFKLQFKHIFLQYILIGIMIFLFVLHKDFTVGGYYKFFFYLVVVGFSEEFIFRGYVYNQLFKYNKWLAIIVSGLFWGILHAILDYQIFRIGTLIAIITGVYFYLKDKKIKNSIVDKKV